MSKIAPVTTGQPAQGIGAVPNGKHQHASPLQAQRAEAEIAEALAAELAPINSRDPYSAVRAASTAAWLSLEAKEIEVRDYFRRIPVASGLEALAKMRHQCDLAAQTLQSRMDEGNRERCTGCGKTLEEVRKSQWIMLGSDMDPETGVPVPYRFCGPLCVRERNRKNMLPKEQRDAKRSDGEDIAEVR